MTNDPADSLARLQEQIRDADALSEADREGLIRFDERLGLLRSTYSVQRHEKLFRHCAILAGLTQRLDPADLPDTGLATYSERWKLFQQLGVLDLG